MAPIGTIHLVEQTAWKAEKALVAAKFNGMDLNKSTFDPKKDATSTDFLTKNPTGKVPFLETDRGCVFTSNSIARYVARCRADTPLYGKCFNDEGQIDSWLEFCTHELEVPLMTWVYPAIGLMQDNAKATADAKQDVKKALQKMETQLSKSQFLIGDCVTLADIVNVCPLKEAKQAVFDQDYLKPFPKTVKWLETCSQMPQFKVVFDDSKKVSKPKADAAKGGQKDKKAVSPKAEPAKKEDKKKEQKPAATPAAAGGADLEAKVKEVGEKIRMLKEKLKGEGLSGKKINDHEEIKTLVTELQELKAQLPAGGAAAPPVPKSPPKSPAKASASPKGGASIEDQVKSLGDEIRAVKEKLKGQGLSGKKINDNDEVKALVGKLSELKAQM